MLEIYNKNHNQQPTTKSQGPTTITNHHNQQPTTKQSQYYIPGTTPECSHSHRKVPVRSLNKEYDKRHREEKVKGW